MQSHTRADTRAMTRMAPGQRQPAERLPGASCAHTHGGRLAQGHVHVHLAWKRRRRPPKRGFLCRPMGRLRYYASIRAITHQFLAITHQFKMPGAVVFYRAPLKYTRGPGASWPGGLSGGFHWPLGASGGRLSGGFLGLWGPQLASGGLSGGFLGRGLLGPSGGLPWPSGLPFNW